MVSVIQLITQMLSVNSTAGHSLPVGGFLSDRGFERNSDISAVDDSFVEMVR